MALSLHSVALSMPARCAVAPNGNANGATWNGRPSEQGPSAFVLSARERTRGGFKGAEFWKGRGTRGAPALAGGVVAAAEEDRRAIDKSETLQEDPYGPVDSVMSRPALTTTEDSTLESILGQFEHFTGLPVVDSAGRCVGIISNIDVARYARGRAGSLPATTVSEVMTSPAFVIVSGAPVAYAAALMLKHKVHRLPVVDHEGVVVGIVTRTDLFEPLSPKGAQLVHRLVGRETPSLGNL